MAEAAFGVELEPLPGGGRDGAIGDIQGRIDILRILEVGKADAPRLSVGPRTDGAVLAHVDEAAGDTGLTQEGDDAIGHITLGDAIECQDHDR
ncbi:hypothetical protein D9M72_588760 [compost metagenome]